KWMRQACAASLERLGSDYIDLYYIHLDYPEMPLDETVQAMGELIREGKVRYFAVSNFRSWRISEIVWLCRQFGVPRPIACQPYYNAFNRMPEVEVLPVCDYHGLGVVPYSPIARGVLSGKYLPGQKPPGDTRAGRGDKRMIETEFREESLVMAQTIRAHAEKRHVTAGQFATAWVLANRIVTSVIAGPRTLEQWLDYPKALDYDWTDADEALVDSLVSPGHPSTPGYNDPKYPLLGRFLRR
ncbi:MAG: aldo/keto reductase, partial [Betaproteobacteria bacterium]